MLTDHSERVGVWGFDYTVGLVRGDLLSRYVVTCWARCTFPFQTLEVMGWK